MPTHESETLLERYQRETAIDERMTREAALEKEVELLREAAKALAIQWRHNAQGCGRKDQHAAGTWRSCARDIEAAMHHMTPNAAVKPRSEAESA